MQAQLGEVRWFFGSFWGWKRLELSLNWSKQDDPSDVSFSFKTFLFFETLTELELVVTPRHGQTQLLAQGADPGASCSGLVRRKDSKHTLLSDDCWIQWFLMFFHVFSSSTQTPKGRRAVYIFPGMKPKRCIQRQPFFEEAKCQALAERVESNVPQEKN